MAYDICQTCLLLPIDLTRGECAAWVQAIGSIVAIYFAIRLAIFQVNKQQQNGLELLLTQKKQELLGSVETLTVLAKQALNLQHVLTKKRLASYELLDEALATGLANELPTLIALEKSLDHIELHKLPSPFVVPCLCLTGSIRQLRLKIDNFFASNRRMNQVDYEDFFKTLDEMNVSLESTVKGFEAELDKLIK